MIKLCFGTFMSVLVQYKSISVTQKKLCGKFLSLIGQNWDISDDDVFTSKLINGYSNLSAGITDIVAEKKPTNIFELYRIKYICWFFCAYKILKKVSKLLKFHISITAI